MYSSFRA
jgi:hypothetical protein